MCTVTFLPTKNNIYITSNRDEHVLRLKAAPPKVYNLKSGQILFPKDGQAGGTWIALHRNGNAMVLLNGAFNRHERKENYSMSRGLIFLNIFDSDNPLGELHNINLEGIESFTIVLWANSTLTEMRWDEKNKHFKILPGNTPHIWSSATLYDKEVIIKREQWFSKWLSGNKNITADSIRSFHEFGGEGNPIIDLLMNRDGLLRTVSITGIELSTERSSVYYKDTLSNIQTLNEWLFAENAVS